ncbi:protein mono-ADP-ribosyltransferase PARP16-like [Pecten maximus]|uniref:protein mono-ADP-ribosyltransferase PARP16-like n=1 Tax=Pecten maximus TaxID=6579 RepID=UPI001459040E|nr:protein mono-ADP-ribosyltransferase PARP16-like [Pecten maximus]XP_033750664.1 protein mono-ADP-ribosyltransferase PARP16-like [Pecten maximus]
MESGTSLRQKIADDQLASDLVVSFFVAALKSYKFDSLLKPFPSSFSKEDGEKDMALLEKTVEEMPTLRYLASNGICTGDSNLNQDLICWILERGSFSIRTLKSSQFEEIRKQTGETVPVTNPDFVFEVIPSEADEAKFKETRCQRKTMFAYHGSRLENFHSILHNGLASHMNKTSVFGEGTYLSSELSVSLLYSPTGLGWEKSCLGHKLSCVAVCEIIDDNSVKCQLKEDGSNGRVKKTRAYAANSEGGDVPEKYYIVQNNDMLRVKYLLLYVEKTSQPKSPIRTQRWHNSWLYQHRFILMIVLYVLLLVLVAVYNSRAFQYHLRKFWKSK